MVWKPGESGNPGGQPKHVKPWREAIMRAIKQREDKDPLALVKLANKLLDKVACGDVAAIAHLADRLDGKVAQAVEMSGKDGGPIQHEMSDTEKARRLVSLLQDGIASANTIDNIEETQH